MGERMGECSTNLIKKVFRKRWFSQLNFATKSDFLNITSVHPDIQNYELCFTEINQIKCPILKFCSISLHN